MPGYAGLSGFAFSPSSHSMPGMPGPYGSATASSARMFRQITQRSRSRIAKFGKKGIPRGRVLGSARLVLERLGHPLPLDEEQVARR